MGIAEGKKAVKYDREHGVDQPHASFDHILDAIFSNESSSGKNPDAYKPDKYGSIGGYQIRPGTFDQVKQQFPARYRSYKFKDVAKDDNLGRQVAFDYLRINKENLIRKGFNPTTEALLATYNAGPGIFRTNTKVGPGVQNYVNKGMKVVNAGVNRLYENKTPNTFQKG